MISEHREAKLVYGGFVAEDDCAAATLQPHLCKLPVGAYFEAAKTHLDQSIMRPSHLRSLTFLLESRSSQLMCNEFMALIFPLNEESMLL